MIRLNGPQTLPAPQFTHDCDACVFLGHAQGFDLYFCGKQGADLPTIIARWSSDGPDYYSGLAFGRDGHYPLSLAYWLAVGAKLLPLPEPKPWK